MKKSDANSYIIYFIIIITTILLGLFVLRPAMANNYPANDMNKFLVAIISLVGSIIVIATAYELMHKLGAKAGGYKVYSLNVLGFNFYKDENDKSKFKFSKFDGLTGETKIAPRLRKNDKICNPKPMLYFGNLFAAAILLVSVLLYLANSANPGAVQVMWTCIIIVDTVFLLYNFFPVELDSKSDGFQLKLVGKESDYPVYNEYLRLQEATYYGKDRGEIKVFTDNMSDFAAKIDLITVYDYIEKNKIYEAIKLIDKILTKKDELHYNVGIQFIAQKLFLQLYTGRFEDAKNFYSELASDEKRDISNSKDFVCIRTYVLISALLDPSESEIQYATSIADKSYKKVEPGYREIEKTLYKGALKVAQEAHPKWTLIIED